MRTFKTTLAIFAAFALMGSGVVLATANEASDSADISASIITPISIVSTQNLDFGQVVASGSAGTVVVSHTGARSSTGGATLGFQGSHAQAEFTVAGQEDNSFSIALPDNEEVELTGPGDPMSVIDFTSDPAGVGSLLGGSQGLNVGATLEVGANQAEGVYTGDFEVTVTYN